MSQELAISAREAALDAAVRSILRFNLACWRAMRAVSPLAVETESVLVAYLEAGLIRQEYRAVLDGNGSPSAISAGGTQLAAGLDLRTQTPSQAVPGPIKPGTCDDGGPEEIAAPQRCMKRGSIVGTDGATKPAAGERLVPRFDCPHPDGFKPCRSRDGEGPMEVCTMCSERRPRRPRG